MPERRHNLRGLDWLQVISLGCFRLYILGSSISLPRNLRKPDLSGKTGCWTAELKSRTNWSPQAATTICLGLTGFVEPDNIRGSSFVRRSTSDWQTLPCQNLLGLNLLRLSVSDWQLSKAVIDGNRVSWVPLNCKLLSRNSQLNRTHSKQLLVFGWGSPFHRFMHTFDYVLLSSFFHGASCADQITHRATTPATQSNTNWSYTRFFIRNLFIRKLGWRIC